MSEGEGGLQVISHIEEDCFRKLLDLQGFSIRTLIFR